MMQPWSKRVVEEANLFNPAFGAVLLAKAADEFTKKSHQPFPFALTFLVLPIVLHHGKMCIRDRGGGRGDCRAADDGVDGGDRAAHP